MSEPRTREAAAVADHAATLLAEVQKLAYPPASAIPYMTEGERSAMRLASLVERLTAQVEDLAADVARLSREVEGEVLP